MSLTSLIVLFVLSTLLCAPAQTPEPVGEPAPVQTIKGTIRNLATRQPLAGATVVVLGTRLGAISRADGSFRIDNAPVGRQSVQARMLGYESVTAQVLVSSGRETVLEFDLQESVVEKKEVVVTADPFKPINETALVSAQSFSVEEVQRYAGGFDDPGRIAQNFAGVAGTNDQQNDIVIRGGSPTELLWRLDGIDIPNPNHFASQGVSGGPINAINSNLLSNSDFFTGAFPAEYGNRISGVFDLHTRNGNRDKYEFVAQMGFNGFEGMAEGPVPGVSGGSFIASYRKSTLEVFDLIGVDLGAGEHVPRYDDATVKVYLPLSNVDNLSFTALGGVSNSDEKDPEFAFTGQELDRDGTDIGAAGSTWTRLISDNIVSQLSASVQYNRYRGGEDSLTADIGGGILDRTETWKRHSGDGSYGATYRLTYVPNPSHQFIAGIEARSMFYDLYEGHPLRAAEFDPYRVEASGNAFRGAGYLSWIWRPLEQLTLNSGVYAQHLALNNTTSIEPRLSGSWKLTDASSINFGFGVHRQAQPLILYFNNTENRNLDFTQSLHYVFGYSNQLASDWLGKIEGYYKDVSHAPVTRDQEDAFSFLNVGPDFKPSWVDWPLKSTGKGRAYGVEMSLLKQFTDGYYVTATGSLFRQEYKGSDDVWRYGVFDNRYIVNLLGGYEWKVGPKFTIEFGLKFTIAGGRRYTPINLDSSREIGWTVYDSTQVYGATFPDYIRLDSRIDFRHNFDGWSLIYYVSTLNTLNRKNALNYSYDGFTDRIEEETQLGLIPVGGIRFEF